jgi:hypothetical protein
MLTGDLVHGNELALLLNEAPCALRMGIHAVRRKSIGLDGVLAAKTSCPLGEVLSDSSEKMVVMVVRGQ